MHFAIQLQLMAWRCKTRSLINDQILGYLINLSSKVAQPSMLFDSSNFNSVFLLKNFTITVTDLQLICSIRINAACFFPISGKALKSLEYQPLRKTQESNPRLLRRKAISMTFESPSGPSKWNCLKNTPK